MLDILINKKSKKVLQNLIENQISESSNLDLKIPEYK
jgi:hypothetical protein